MEPSGYMSPEYAIDGIFSVKSNVFSFRVLVLEIVSRKRNRQFYHPEHDLNLLGDVSHFINSVLLPLQFFVHNLLICICYFRHGNYGLKRRFLI